MTLLAVVTIADISLCIEGDGAIQVTETEAAMQPFFRTCPRLRPSDADAVRITIRRDAIPHQRAGLVKCFDSEQAWSLWASMAGYVLTLQPPGVSSPLWQMDMASDFSQGRLHCHGDFWQKASPVPVLRNPIRYPLDQILVMLRLARREGIILHAAGAVINDQGYLFLGKSGAGKSTLAGLLAVEAWAALLSDDRVIVRRVNGRWMAHGTPWPGEAGIAANRSVPLAGVFFLNKAATFDSVPLTPGEALVKLLPVASIPFFDRHMGDAVLSSCESLVTEVPMSDLQFTPEQQTATHLMRLTCRTPPP